MLVTRRLFLNRQILKSFLFTLALFLGAGRIAIAEEPLQIYIESASKESGATLLSGTNSSSPHLGDSLAPSDRIQTKDVAVRIVYPDGSTETLGKNSDLEIKKPEAGADSKPIFISYLHSGFVHARAKHQANPNDEPHFIIESKTAVAGVRGTEFTMTANNAEDVQVHTLEGKVAVSNERIKIKEAQLYSAGEFARVKGGQVAAPEKFNLMDYRKKINSEHPEVHKLIYNKVKAQEEIHRHPRHQQKARAQRRRHK
jgi:hypothetical protein